MNFYEVVANEYRRWKSIPYVPSPTEFHAGVVDIIKDDFECAEKEKVFLAVSSKLFPVGTFMSNGAKRGRESLIGRYSEVQGIVDQEMFDDIVETLSYAEAPNEYKLPQSVNSSKNTSNNTKNPQAGAKGKNPTPKANNKTTQTPAVQQPAPTPAVQQPTPAPATQQTYVNTHSEIGTLFKVLIPILIVGGVITLMVIFFDWTAWQWVIGIGGGILVELLLWGLSYLCMDDEAYMPIAFVAPVIIAVNIILAIVNRESYIIIFGCFSVINIINSLISIFMSFSDIEDGYGVVHIIEGVIDVVAAIVLFIIIL